MQATRETISRGIVIVLLVVIIGLPFALRREEQPALVADDVVVVITPHNEAIRTEFARGFSDWYQTRTGRSIAVDWRTIGGTSEITRFIESEYTTSFRNHWQDVLGFPWTNEVRRSFDDSRVTVGPSPENDTEAQSARRAFLNSSVGCGIDVFFGGGVYDFIRQAEAGRLVESGIFARHPEWFTDAVIPQTHAGESLWDPEHRWISAVLSGFGILYNRDALARLRITDEPDEWRDLADPRYLGELALADPTKSSSIAKAFEMVLQREMQTRLHQLEAAGAAGPEEQAVREGWIRGFEVIQLLGANARYFTDSSQKVPIDVAQGDAAAGMCIDFYGRAQAEAVIRRDQSPRLAFVTPRGGSVFSGDSIAMLRGAPHPDEALDFITFVLSPEGQRMWNLRMGSPGGPTTYNLRRNPVRKDLYRPEFDSLRTDPAVNPYAADNDFFYNSEWTGGIFREMAFLIRIVCIDTHPELVEAWREIIAAGLPAEALAAMQNFATIDYETTITTVRTTLRAGDPINEIRLAKSLGNQFRQQYRQAAEIARSSR